MNSIGVLTRWQNGRYLSIQMPSCRRARIELPFWCCRKQAIRKTSALPSETRPPSVARASCLAQRGPDPLCRRVLRVSMGASLQLPWARIGGPEEFRALALQGFVSAASVLDPNALDLRSWRRPDRLALVFGNEAFGLSDPWLNACDLRVTLPMRGGTDSLNVATAVALFLYALGC